jgi:hypothetical protein
MKYFLAGLITGIMFLAVDAWAGEYRVGIMPSSKHLAKSHQYNENQMGLIAEFKVRDKGKEHGWVSVMHFTNSEGDASNSILYDQHLWQYQRLETSWAFGAVVGYEDWSPAPVLTLNFTLHFDYIKGRAALIPGIVYGKQLLYEFGEY